MHFLEDDLQLVNGLKDAFHDRCADIQELDKKATAISAAIKIAKQHLYTNYNTLPGPEKEEKIKEVKDKFKTLKDLNNKKYELARDLEQLIDRVNNKVKKDTHDFRYELEMENPGCTYELEKKFTEEFDEKKKQKPSTSKEAGPSRHKSHLNYSQLNDLFNPKSGIRSRSGSDTGALTKRLTINTGNLLSAGGRRRTETGSFRPSPASDIHSPTPSTSRSTPRTTPGPISPAIRSAYQRSYRQSFSSMDAMEPSTSADFDPSNTSMPSFAGGHESRHGRPRKLTSRLQHMLKETKIHRPGQYQPVASPLATGAFNMMPSTSRPNDSRRNSVASSSRRMNLREGTESLDEYEEEETEEPFDEGAEEEGDEDNEIWCTCQTKAYGEMVACDNPNCPTEWFHYECVGVTARPQGKWFCPQCRLH